MIEIKNLSKTFVTPDNTVEALKNINLTINDGEIYGIIGMSGAGKSTLVRCINMLERPTSGTVIVNGVDLSSLSDKELRAERSRITMVFQGFNLLMQRNCLKNVCFPLELAGMNRSAAKARAMELLEVVGLPDKAKSYPSQLSGGQQQRVAIARALATDPKVLLCDEATSALDPKTTEQILNLIRDINERLGITVIVITHQMSVVESICGRVAIMDNGEVAEVGSVADIFSHPKSAVAKRLVFPDSAETAELSGDERLIRVIFNGQISSGRPVIAEMALTEGIAANICYASTKTISGNLYGNMILGIPNDDDTVRRALAFLERENVSAEEVHDQ